MEKNKIKKAEVMANRRGRKYIYNESTKTNQSHDCSERTVILSHYKTIIFFRSCTFPATHPICSHPSLATWHWHIYRNTWIPIDLFIVQYTSSHILLHVISCGLWNRIPNPEIPFVFTFVSHFYDLCCPFFRVSYMKIESKQYLFSDDVV